MKERILPAIGLTLLLALPAWAMGSSQQPEQTQRIETDQQTESPASGQNIPADQKPKTGEPKSVVESSKAETHSAKGRGNAEQTSDDGGEFWTIFGHRVKITDTLLAVFTFLLFVSTTLLWRETRKGGKTTEKLAIAAERSAKAAIGIELPIIRQREWPELLHLSEPVPESRSYSGLRVDNGRPRRYSTLHTVEVWNAGRTPAIATAIRIGWEVCVRLPDTPVYRHAERYPGGLTIRAGQENGYTLDPGAFTIELSEPEIADVASDKRWFWLFIEIEFSDFIHETHHARLCWRWDTFGVNVGQYFPNAVEAPEAYTKNS